MPKIEEKQAVINEIKAKFDKAASVVLVNARGVTVEQDTALRAKLREIGADYKVYKNTMLERAARGTELEGLQPFFKGPTTVAICYGEPTAAARLINGELKNIPQISFKAGIVGGVLYGGDDMAAVAAIAPREELLARLLGAFKAPMGTFARLIKNIAEKA